MACAVPAAVRATEFTTVGLPNRLDEVRPSVRRLSVRLVGSDRVPVSLHRHRSHGRAVRGRRHLRDGPRQVRHPERLLRRGQPVGTGLAAGRWRLRPGPHQPCRGHPDSAGRYEGRRSAVVEADRGGTRRLRRQARRQGGRLGGLATSPRQHRRHRCPDENPGHAADVRQHSTRGRQRRRDPEELPGRCTRPETDQRRRHQAGRAQPTGQ